MAERKKQTVFRILSAEEKLKIYEWSKGLLISIARKYAGIFPDLTVEYLVQVGSLGLFNAAETFDPNRECLFFTYAYGEIRGAITRALTNEGRIIRLPADVVADLIKRCRAEKILSHELGRKPSAKEIATKAGIPIDRIKKVGTFIDVLTTTSLESPVEGRCETGKLVEFIADERSESPIDLASRNILLADLKRFLEDNLTPRNRKILQLKFGLEDGRYRTDGEIAEEVNVGMTRVGQILKAIFHQARKHFDLLEDEL